MTEPADAPDSRGQLTATRAASRRCSGHVQERRGREPIATSVHDAIGGRPRLNWSPVTDAEAAVPATENAAESLGLPFRPGRRARATRWPDDLRQAPRTTPAPPTPVQSDRARAARAPRRGTSGHRPGRPRQPPPRRRTRRPSSSARSSRCRSRPSAPPRSSPPGACAADRPSVRRRVAAPTPLEPLPRRGERPSPNTPGTDRAGQPRAIDRSIRHRPPIRVRRRARPRQPDAARRHARAAGPIVPHAAGAPPARSPPAPADLAVRARTLLPTLPAADRRWRCRYPRHRSIGPATPDINALRSAQLRASRQQRQGKLFSRTLLVLFLIGGLIAAAMMLRPRLPVPDRVGPGIDPDRRRDPDRAGCRVRAHRRPRRATARRLRTDDRSARRRRRLAGAASRCGGRSVSPPATPPSTASPRRSARTRLAVYDPDADRIYLSAGADPDGRRSRPAGRARAGLRRPARPAGEPARRRGAVGFVGVSPPPADRRGRGADVPRRPCSPRHRTTPAPSPRRGRTPTVALPLPIEYELHAVEHLGEALLAAAGRRPDARHLRTDLPDSLGAALDDGADADRERSAAGRRPVARHRRCARCRRLVVGVGRTPSRADGRPTVGDRHRRLVSADRSRRFDLRGRRVRDCRSPTDAAFVLSAMQTWAAAGTGRRAGDRRPRSPTPGSSS